jgi:hypothetical protein
MAVDTKIKRPQPTSSEAVALLARGLERILGDLGEQYARLHSLAQARLSAMRRADPAALGACISQENLAVQEIVEIEKRRVRIVGDLASMLGSTKGVGTGLLWIAERIDGAIGERLTTKAQQLREAMEAVRRLNEVGAVVAERLARHMEGLWAQVAATLNHSKTYGRMGAVQPGPRVVSALDLTS